MFKKNKFIPALGFLVALTSAFSVYAEDTDPCNNLKGAWKGTWITTSSIIDDVRCRYEAAIVAEQNDSKTMLQITLTNSNHRHLCKPKVYTVTGLCAKGKLTFSDYFLEGEVIGNLMSLSGTYSYVRGSFTKS